MNIISPTEARDLVQHQILAANDVDPAVFVGQYIRQHDLDFDDPPGQAIMAQVFENSIHAFDELKHDYAASLAAGLITDGHASFDTLLDEWHERVAGALDAFDEMIENERTANEAHSLQAAVSRIMETRNATHPE